MATRGVKVDPLVGAAWAIEAEHGLIHAGRMFSASFPTTNIAGAGVTNFLLRPDASETHFRWRVESDKLAFVDVYEDPTVTLDGAPVEVLNVNRDSLLATGVLCFSGATIAVDGTLLDPHILGDAGGGGGMGDTHKGVVEWAGNAALDYLWVVTTLGVNTRINWNVRFYEVLV